MEMENSQQAIVATAIPEVDSQLSSLLYDLSQQVQGTMEDLLKTINEIDGHSAEVTEEMVKCKESALERRKAIEEEKECFQKAAFAVLDVLNMADGRSNDQMFLENGDNGSEY